MIAESTLKEWREEAHNELKYIKTMAIDSKEISRLNEIQGRILQMVQELLDHLRQG